MGLGHGAAMYLDVKSPFRTNDPWFNCDLHMPPNHGQAIERFVVGLKIQMQVGIRVLQHQSLPAIASLLVLCNKLHALAGRSARLLHSGVGRILAAAEKRCLDSGPLQRSFRRLDTNRQDQMLSEPRLRDRKLKLQLTGTPCESFGGLRLRSAEGCGGRNQGADAGDARRNKERATIHEFIRIRGISRQTQFESNCIVGFRMIALG